MPSPQPPRSTVPRALVFGASGYIGTHLVPRCCAKAGAVRAAARNRKVLQARATIRPGARSTRRSRCAGARTLPAALAGIDIAYYLVHSMAAGRTSAGSTWQAAENFARAAARGRRAAHRLPGRPGAEGCRFRASGVARADRRAAARGPGAGHRDPRRHHRRRRLGRLRGDPRPRLPPAADGDAALGAVASRARSR